MNTKFVAFVILLLGGLVLFGCVQQPPAPTATPTGRTPTPAPTVTPTPAPTGAPIITDDDLSDVEEGISTPEDLSESAENADDVEIDDNPTG